MYRFLRRPRWILLTAATVVVMVVMVNLGFWQLRRLDERRTRNHEVTTRSAVAPAAVDDLLPPAITATDIGALQWRRVTATGTYDVAHEVVIADRSLDGMAGLHVVTPLVLDDGRALLVNRGWIQVAAKVGEAPKVPPAATGTVTVVGRIRPTQTRGWLGPRDPATGVLHQLARVDVARIAAQTPEPLVPAYVEEVRADDGALPRPIPLPVLDDGPHLSYAGQWFLFTACAAGGWYALVRRHGKLARQAARRAELSAAGPGPDDGARRRPDDVAATTEPPGTAVP